MRICFVCSGNMCRSPFAESVLRRMLQDNGITDVSVCSVGTLNLSNAGRDIAMIDVAHELGYDLEGTTTYMGDADYSDIDLILTMSAQHRDALTGVVPFHKWDCIKSFCEYSGLDVEEVPDPYYQSAVVYRYAADLIVKGCENIVRKLKDES